MNWYYLLYPILIIVIISTASGFSYYYMILSEIDSIKNQVFLQCIRKKNSTMFEIRGGTTVFYSLHKLIRISNSSNPGDIWYNFATEVTTNSNWRYIGSGILQEFNSTGLKQWSSLKNVIPTERNAITGKREPVSYNREKYLIITENFPNRTSVGFDYYSDPERNSMVELGKKTRNLTVSDPTSAINTIDKTVIFFIPIFNDITTSFTGGISGAYYAKNMTPVPNEGDAISISLSINGVTAYEDSTYNSTNYQTVQSFNIADKAFSIKCGTNYDFSYTPKLILSIGVLISVILAILVLVILLLNNKTKKALIEKLKIEKQQVIIESRSTEAMNTAKAKTEFLSNMSHEIRTPLNGVLWMINFLLNSKLNEEQKELAQTVQISSQSLLQIINDILDLNKIEAGKLDIELISINLINHLHQLDNMYQIISKKNNNQFILVLSSILEDDKFVKIDPTRLTQILNNLINNSFKFTKNGIVKLLVYKSGDQLYFEVSDTGIGMTEEQVQKLFSPYQQGDISVSRRFGGTGLGLSICKNLLMLMNGKINCSSTLGKGSVFSFSLPFIKGLPVIDTIDTMDVKFSGHILVAEDNHINQRVIKKLLTETYGLSVTLVDNGEQVVQLMNSDSPFNAILMDVQMPIMDGLEATKIIRAKGFDLPIIAFTASALKDEREKCLVCGMNDFLAKPIIKDELTTILTNLFKRNLYGKIKTITTK